MNRMVSLSLLVVVGLACVAAGAEPTEPFLRNLPPGVVLEASTEASAAQAEAIGRKLGAQIVRITNSMVLMHGRRIQVNAITTAGESDAEAVLASLRKMKRYPFCFRSGLTVIEYVGKQIDEALAVKASYELGLQEKPSRVRYRVTADLAAVEKADYMACNPLFNSFLALAEGDDPEAIRQIADLSTGFTFGRSVTLRNPEFCRPAAAYAFRPESASSGRSGAGVVFTFEKLPTNQGVPYVTATLDVTVDDTGFQASEAAPSEALTAATPFWPVDDPDVVALAEQITAGRTTNDGKVAAILEWLTPGRNLEYKGEMGSRWGTARVLEQKFGHCWDFSDCFVTLARAAGVPGRQVGGWFYGTGGHVWAEFYREGEGWQQVDPTGGGKLRCGIYHIPYFTTEDGDMPILYVAMPKIEVVSSE